MGLLITTQDFTGKYKIAQNSFSELDAYINRYEAKYLIDLLGAELYKLFKNDINSGTKQPNTPIYKTIYDPILEDVNGCIINSDGLKNMILGFVYFEYLRDEKFKSTVSGKVVNSSEISRESTFDESNVYSRYNESIATYNTIRYYISLHLEDYPLFNGVSKKFAHWSL